MLPADTEFQMNIRTPFQAPLFIPHTSSPDCALAYIYEYMRNMRKCLGDFRIFPEESFIPRTLLQEHNKRCHKAVLFMPEECFSGKGKVIRM